MEVMVGPAFGIDVSASSYVIERSGIATQDKAVSTALFLGDESGRVGTQIGLSEGRNSPEESSESSSSIGEPENSSEDEEEEDDAVTSKGGLVSFSSLQDCLPIKRGLSNHYAGKSKSFANLSEVGNVKEMEKTENPLNKKRRVLIASKMRSRRSSSSSSLFYSWQNPKSMPLLPLQETDDHDGDDKSDEGNHQDEHGKMKRMVMMMKNNNGSLMSRSCFCLNSLQEEDE